MSKLIDTIEQKRFLTQEVEKIKTEFEKQLREFEMELKEKVKEVNFELVKKVATNILKDIKGDKGDKPIKGIDYFIKEEIDLIKKEIMPIKNKDYFDGKNGLDGINGMDGKNGKNGIDGLDGLNGKDGLDGINGKDGSPDTPEQIAKKLNTLNEILELDLIKGLKEFIIKNIPRQRLGGGGGGLGLPVSQTFTGNGSTTQFTLSNNVAANGKAIWVYYNGQYLVPTTHFTISDKTLTTTFTPENGTSIDVLFIRT